MTSSRYRLLGSVGSPSALKLRALLRYRRVPFDWVPTSLDWVREGLPHPPLSDRSRREIANMKPAVVPAVWFPQDGSFRNDSTVIAYELEKQSGERSIIPPDPVWAFLSHLLEDMADEWGVKIAFNYRWGYAEDSHYKSRIVVGELLGGGYDEVVQLEAAKHFAQRQIGRMQLVGCALPNREAIEATFHRILDVVNRLPTTSNFIFGDVASLADFGWYGQLLSLATDPTPTRIIQTHAPGVFQYLQLLEDASGIDACWPE